MRPAAGQLRHRLVALDGRQGHFGLEGRAVFHSFLLHVPAPLHCYSRSGTLSASRPNSRVHLNSGKYDQYFKTLQPNAVNLYSLCLHRGSLVGSMAVQSILGMDSLGSDWTTLAMGL